MCALKGSRPGKRGVVSIAKRKIYNTSDLLNLYYELYFNVEIVCTKYSGNKKKL